MSAATILADGSCTEMSALCTTFPPSFATLSPTEAGLAGCDVDPGVDYNGNDIQIIPNVSQPGACQALCQQEPECNFWSSGTTDVGPRCWLKSSIRSQQPRVSRISGPKYCRPTAAPSARPTVQPTTSSPSLAPTPTPNAAALAAPPSAPAPAPGMFINPSSNDVTVDGDGGKLDTSTETGTGEAVAVVAGVVATLALVGLGGWAGRRHWQATATGPRHLHFENDLNETEI